MAERGIFFADDVDVCPYNPSHTILRTRMQTHLVKCRKNNMDAVRKLCPFNATHHIIVTEFSYHISVCPDRRILDNFKYTVSPSTVANNTLPVENREIPCDENWDTEDVPTYDPVQRLQDGKLLVQIKGATPSEREKFRQERRQLFLEQGHHIDTQVVGIDGNGNNEIMDDEVAKRNVEVAPPALNQPDVSPGTMRKDTFHEGATTSDSSEYSGPGDERNSFNMEQNIDFENNACGWQNDAQDTTSESDEQYSTTDKSWGSSYKHPVKYTSFEKQEHERYMQGYYLNADLKATVACTEDVERSFHASKKLDETNQDGDTHARNKVANETWHNGYLNCGNIESQNLHPNSNARPGKPGWHTESQDLYTGPENHWGYQAGINNNGGQSHHSEDHMQVTRGGRNFNPSCGTATNSWQGWQHGGNEGPVTPSSHWGVHGNFGNLASTWRDTACAPTFDAAANAWPNLQQANDKAHNSRKYNGRGHYNDLHGYDNARMGYDEHHQSNYDRFPKTTSRAANFAQNNPNNNSNFVFNAGANTFMTKDQLLPKTPDYGIRRNACNPTSVDSHRFQFNSPGYSRRMQPSIGRGKR